MAFSKTMHIWCLLQNLDYTYKSRCFQATPKIICAKKIYFSKFNLHLLMMTTHSISAHTYSIVIVLRNCNGMLWNIHFNCETELNFEIRCWNKIRQCVCFFLFKIKKWICKNANAYKLFFRYSRFAYRNEIRTKKSLASFETSYQITWQ